MPTAGRGWEVCGVRSWMVLEDIQMPAAAAALMFANAGNVLLGQARDVLIGAGLADVTKPILDISRFTASFAVNTIPSATATIALGRLASDVSQVATIHELRDFMSQRLRVSVYSQITRRDERGGSAQVWTGKPFRVFDGYTAGCSYRRSDRGADFVVALEHWLSDMTLSSSVSSNISPQNPGAMAFPAAMRFIGQPGGPAGTWTATNTGLTLASNLITVPVINRDFWAPAGPGLDGRGLLAWLKSLTATNAMRLVPRVAELSGDQGVVSNLTNRSAIAALNRFETSATRVWSSPLAFQTPAIGGQFAAILAQQMASNLASTTIEALFSVTLWDALISLGARFGFAVIPMVEKALVVPFVKGLRNKYINVSPYEYDYVEQQRGPVRTVRAVAVYARDTFSTGQVFQLPGTPPQNVDSTIGGVGGWYQGRTEGQILWFQAPAWMTNGTVLPQSAALTLTGPASGLAPGRPLTPAQVAAMLLGRIGTGPASSPEAVLAFGPVADGLVAGDQAAKQVQQAAAVSRTCMDRYAHLLYVNEVLSHRQGSLGGPLRFDIAPGSSILIGGVGEKFIAGNDQLTGNLFATVLQSSFTLDANPKQPNASSSFHLTHVRSDKENTLDASSIDAHPFWADVWTGAPLIEVT